MPYLQAPESLGDIFDGEPQYRADQLRDWLYKTPVLRAGAMTNLPGSIRDRLEGRLWPFEVEMDSPPTRRGLESGCSVPQTAPLLSRC